MKNIRSILSLLGGAALLLTAACSTPASRIKANPEAFARLSRDQQVLVQAGQVALGFEFEAVRLALGEPDRVTTRTDERGQTTVWHFLIYEIEGRILFTGHYHSGRNWWGWGASYPYYLDYPTRTVRDRFRVEFSAGRVIAITRDESR
ncbi:MAG: hypothetical protein RLZZ188_438 [Verrucomicrobiota bacterium]